MVCRIRSPTKPFIFNTEDAADGFLMGPGQMNFGVGLLDQCDFAPPTPGELDLRDLDCLSADDDVAHQEEDPHGFCQLPIIHSGLSHSDRSDEPCDEGLEDQSGSLEAIVLWVPPIDEREEQQPQCASDKPPKIGKRLDWKETAREKILANLGRQAATWIKKEKKITKPLSPTSFEARRAYIAHCDACKECSLAWCFTRQCIDGADWMFVEVMGKCDGPKNTKRMSLEYARVYCVEKNLEPGQALKEMRNDKVPVGLRPSTDQMKNQRKNVAVPGKKNKHYSAACLGALEAFLQQPPEGVHIFHAHVVIESTLVRIPFSSELALQHAGSCTLTGFLMDFTFSTNIEGLLLGGAGPVGLRLGDRLPHMRFVPTVFVLADAEDKEAHTLCMEVLFSLRPEGRPQFTDAFLDCRCLGSAERFCGDRVYLHRCLQHVKKNVKAAAKERTGDKKGLSRLRNLGLLDSIIEWVEFSAWLPSDHEFDAFWRSILDRMRNARCETDWDEPDMASYLETHILDCSADLIKASWNSGYGAVPLGFTTYAPNAVESTWRVLKGLLDPGYAWGNCGKLLGDVVASLDSRFEAGAYENLVQEIRSPLGCLLAWPLPKMSGRNERASDDANCHDKNQHVRLDLDKLLQHLRSQGQEQTYLCRDCDVKLSTGARAVRVYILPKYTLRFAFERQGDMQSTLALAMASTSASVKVACLHERTRTYDIFRHMYLRRTFVSVYVLDDGSVVDVHKNFVEGAGQSEHGWLVSGLEPSNPFRIGQAAAGPVNSRPGGKRGAIQKEKPAVLKVGAVYV